MKYNFDEIVERRNTNAMNTDGFREYIFGGYPGIEFPFADDEFIRMWVADMEFATPPEICQAIKDRVDNRIFGYTLVYDPGYYAAFSKWCDEKYGWSFPKEQLVYSPGIIPALYEIAGDVLGETDKILITSPAYGFFKHTAEYVDRELVCSPLKNDNGYFTIDFDDLAAKAADPDVKLLIWCNPHNPTGRVWKEEELKKVAEIAEKNDLWVISDEIHCDLLRCDQKHIPMAKVMKDYDKLVTAMAASKTFNMAGFMFSNIIIRNKELRELFCAHDRSILAVNPLSLAANQAAYEKGGQWLDQLKEYLDENFRYLVEFLEEHLPDAVCRIPEATYLAWVDLRKCLPDVEDLPLFFAREAGVLLEGGDKLFVGNADGFVRLNLALPKTTLKEGLERIEKSIKKHK